MSKLICDSLRERQRQQRTDAILDAARELTLETGYEALTMDALAARAGVTKPTLYAHFPNKEAIAVASIVRNIHRGQAGLAQLDPSLSPLTKLEKYFRWALVGKFVERKIAFGGAPVAVIRANPEYQAVFQEMMQSLSAIFEAGKACGEIAPGLDTRTALQTFVSVLRDTGYDELLRSEAVAADVLVETLTRILMGGLRREK